MRIVRAGTRDAERVARIGIETYRDHFADFWTPAGLEAWLARQFDPAKLAAELAGDAIRYELAYDGDRLVGYAKTIRDQPVPLDPAARGLELQKIYFRRGETGRGRGVALLEHVVALARELREPRVWLQVLGENAAAARFYARNGFVHTGTFLFPGDRGDAPMHVMVRALQ